MAAIESRCIIARGSPARARLARSTARVRADLPLAVLDAVLVAGVYAAVLILRFDGHVPHHYWDAFRLFVPVAVALHLCSNALLGLYGRVWIQAGVDEARRVVLAGAGATSILTLLYIVQERRLPISVVVLGGALAILLGGVLRFHSRLLVFQGTRSERRRATRIVVIGAGNAGGTIVRELLRDPSPGLTPVAVLDQDPRKRGRSLASIPVLGGLSEMRQAVAVYGAEEALLAMPSATGDVVRTVMAAATAAGIPMKILPTVRDIVGGDVGVRDIRDVQISDLLGREQVSTDLDSVRSTLAGRRVLITGAGGSIGSEIARQVSRCSPGELVLVDHDETHLHDTLATLDGGGAPVLADIRDGGRMHDVFARHRPDVVFHAAALKHVPILESHPQEAIRTNVVGSRNVFEAAARWGVDRLVFISTDKAVRPTSVMGASKRLGEQLLLRTRPPGAAWCAVRFGNVLGSRGSVIPTFARQIAEGGPVTVTDPGMTRFFMSIPEAVALVLQSGTLGRGNEVFMLEMGQPVRILDLAERMIRLSGRRIGSDVRIQITGARPGEKLHEELHAPDEVRFPTSHPSIVRLHPLLISHDVLDAGVDHLVDLAADGSDDLGPALHRLVSTPGAAFRLRAGEVDPAVVRTRALERPRDGRWTRAGDATVPAMTMS